MVQLAAAVADDLPRAAALTGLTEANIRLAIRRGDLIACYAYTTIKRIRRRDLDDWLASLPENPE
ncbi:DNA-binding protein [Bifidobacterium moukalabense]|uniref:DNA-binding protein n=1 Tax=Bifidobacterium moukalabense TaxID=1333651 RepID=UPI0010F938C0|nr:DNA-binding protein [Bifidobacterium moukalabense]